MIDRIHCVVEGHGDQRALPILLRRVRDALVPQRQVEFQVKIRRPKSTLIREGELERAVKSAALGTGPNGAVLVVMDADQDCPAELGPTLQARAERARPDRVVSVVVAKHEFEAWFLAAARSLRGKRGLPDNFAPAHAPEERRGAKELISSAMIGQSYSETIDQPALAAQMDLEEARGNSPSFDKLWREIERLLDV